MRPRRPWSKKQSTATVKNAIAASWRNKDFRLWKRLKAIWMYFKGQDAKTICETLEVSRRSMFYWIDRYSSQGIQGLQEGDHTGRPPVLETGDLERLAEIIDSGPVACGFDSGIWTCPRIGHVIQEEFGVHYHEDHIRKILHQLGFSVQRPTKKLAKADPKWQQKWIRHTYPALKKTVHRKEGL